ncbi:MAG: hypothetical protein R8M45_11150 [Ghiorsea sp.]
MTAKTKDRTLGQMMKSLLFVPFILLLTACAGKPPVQAMAEARAAVQSVRPYYTEPRDTAVIESKIAHAYYLRAEAALLEAGKALDGKDYALAKQKAFEAKRKARLAAKLIAE